MSDIHPHLYRELGLLAEGGMATLTLGRRDDGLAVVIKRVHPALENDPAIRALFRDEGAIAGSLSHPHIVRLLDMGEDDRGSYLIFEHIEGTDLAIVLERCVSMGQGLDLPAFLAIAEPLFDALAFAHDARSEDDQHLEFVHRDISPGNLLLGLRGEVKLADFGVASSVLKHHQTVAGEMKGKFAYMSPEQTRGELVDSRSDLFSAGALLWEALCGAPLFDGPTDADVVHAVRERQPAAPSKRSPELPAELDALVLHLLEKDPARRPPKAADVLTQLKDLSSAFGLETGRKRHVIRLARDHKRPDPATPSDEASSSRRRTQRVVGEISSGAHTNPPGATHTVIARRGMVSILLAGAALGALWWWSGPKGPPSPPGDSPGPQEAPLPVGTPSSDQPAPSPSPLGDLDAGVPTPTAPTRPAARSSEPTTQPRPPKAGRTNAQAPPQRSRVPPASLPPTVPATRAEGGFGELFLSSDPWAEVTIDGVPLGANTPVLGLRLPAGPHQILLKNPHYGLQASIQVVVTAGAQVRRYVDLAQN